MKNKLGIKIFFEFKYADKFKEFINVVGMNSYQIG